MFVVASELASYQTICDIIRLIIYELIYRSETVSRHVLAAYCSSWIVHAWLLKEIEKEKLGGSCNLNIFYQLLWWLYL